MFAAFAIVTFVVLVTAFIALAFTVLVYVLDTWGD